MNSQPIGPLKGLHRTASSHGVWLRRRVLRHLRSRAGCRPDSGERRRLGAARPERAARRGKPRGAEWRGWQARHVVLADDWHALGLRWDLSTTLHQKPASSCSFNVHTANRGTPRRWLTCHSNPPVSKLSICSEEMRGGPSRGNARGPKVEEMI